MTDRVEIHDVRDPLDGGGYRDIRHFLERYELHECWNCGHEHFERRHRGRNEICEECLMGQNQHGMDLEASTPEGYTDKGRLFYGDIDREEMRRRFKDTSDRQPIGTNVEVVL